jgi:hypothetical protein
MFHDVTELSNWTLLQLLQTKKGHIKAKELEADASKSPENYDNISTDLSQLTMYKMLVQPSV